MRTLSCDIAGPHRSTSAWLTYNRRVLSREQFIVAVKKAITNRAKTLPKKQAIRSACLVGIIYDQFNGDEYLLDVVLEAIGSS